MSNYLLFAEDWATTGAVIHTRTRNKSALAFAAKLKSQGIKNHAFFLALYDERLMDIDPFDDDLTNEQMSWIALECRVNPWYFFRECVRIPMKASAALKEYKFNRQVVAMLWCFLNRINLTGIQIRQTGKSLWLMVLEGWLCNCALYNAQLNHVSKDRQLLGEYLNGLKEQLLILPKAVRMFSERDVANTEKLIVSAVKNRIIGHVPQSSEQAAFNLGRGLTGPIVIWDEPAFSVNFQKSISVILSTMNAAKQDAIAAGVPSGMVFTTTAGSLKTAHGKYFYDEFVARAARWSEGYYDCKNNADAVARVRAHCTGETEITHMLIEFNHRQLGLTDEWLYATISEVRATGVVADMEFFNIWDVSGGSESIHDQETAARIGRQKQEPCHIEVIQNQYHLNWYVPKINIHDYMKTNKIVIGLDTSNAISRDNMCLIGINAYTGKQVFSLTVSLTNNHTFALFIADFMIKYENTILIPEARSSGPTIIDVIISKLVAARINPFKRIFNWCVHEYDTITDDSKELIKRNSSEYNASAYDRFRAKFGYATSGSGKSSRENLYGDAFSFAINEQIENIADAVLVDQLLGLRKNKNNGRIDHSEGGHDDMVVAWLLALWFLSKTRNLKLYGIDSYNVLQPTTEGKVEELDELNYRNYLKSIIKENITLLKKTNTEILRDRIVSQIRRVESELNELGDVYVGLDAILTATRKK